MTTVRRDVTAILNGAAEKPNTPTNGGTTVKPSAPTPTTGFKVGDVVKIIATTYYSGKEVPAWVKAKNWVVYSVSGDRIVVNKSEDGKNAIMSPFKASDLALVYNSPSQPEKPAVEPPSAPKIDGTPSTGSAADEKVIWDYLLSKIGNEYGVAGVMGNLKAESSLISNNLQNAYEKKLGYTDATYTAAVDNGSYTNFANDGAGYGLAQWTYHTRKQALLDYAKSKNKSVGDLTVQLDYLYKELSERYTPLLATLANAKSVAEASNAFLLQFERPANQGADVQNRRAANGEVYYKQYARQVVVTPTPEPSQPDEDTVYIVQKGDTLAKIASKFGTTYQKLAEYNGISNPSLIRVGQKIKIPSKGNVTDNKKNVIEVGDVVKIIGTQYYSGANIPAWVRNKNWIVYSAPEGKDRIVINKSEDGKSSIMSPVKRIDLAIVKKH